MPTCIKKRHPDPDRFAGRLGSGQDSAFDDHGRRRAGQHHVRPRHSAAELCDFRCDHDAVCDRCQPGHEVAGAGDPDGGIAEIGE